MSGSQDLEPVPYSNLWVLNGVGLGQGSISPSPKCHLLWLVVCVVCAQPLSNGVHDQIFLDSSSMLVYIWGILEPENCVTSLREFDGESGSWTGGKVPNRKRILPEDLDSDTEFVMESDERYCQ